MNGRIGGEGVGGHNGKVRSEQAWVWVVSGRFMLHGLRVGGKW